MRTLQLHNRALPTRVTQSKEGALIDLSEKLPHAPHAPHASSIGTYIRYRRSYPTESRSLNKRFCPSQGGTHLLHGGGLAIEAQKWFRPREAQHQPVA